MFTSYCLLIGPIVHLVPRYLVEVIQSDANTISSNNIALTQNLVLAVRKWALSSNLAPYLTEFDDEEQMTYSSILKFCCVQENIPFFLTISGLQKKSFTPAWIL